MSQISVKSSTFKILTVFYVFLLPLQTRYFLVDSAVEYQRISVYGTQILFLFILILYFFYHSRPDVLVGINSNGNPEDQNKQKQTVIAKEPGRGMAISGDAVNERLSAGGGSAFGMTSTSSPHIAGSHQRRDNDKFFLFSFLDSGSKAGMTVFFLFFIALQLIVSSKIGLTIQTLFWILQTVLFVWIVKRENLAKPVLWAFVVSMAVQSVFIWIQFVTQTIPAFKWFGLAEHLSWQGGVSVIEAMDGRFLRGYGLFPHPNIAGGFLLVAIISLIRLSLRGTKQSSNQNTTLGDRSSRFGQPRREAGEAGHTPLQSFAMTDKSFLLHARPVVSRYFGTTTGVTCCVIQGLLVSGLVLTFSRSALLGLVIFIVLQFIYYLSSSTTSRLRHSGLGYDGRIEDPEINSKNKKTVIASRAERGVACLAERESRRAISGDARNEIASSKTSRNDRYFFFSFLDSCFRRNDGRGVIRFVLTLLLFFLAVAIPLKYLVFSRADFSNRLEQISANERALYNQYSREIIKKNLLLGVGLGNYSVTLEKLHPELEAYDIQPPHSVPLLLLSELGIAGVVFFVLIIVGLLFYTLYSIPYTLLLAISPLFLFDHYAWSLYAGWALISLIVIVWSRRKANLES